MSKATITSKGQITIPLAIRNALNLQERDRLEFRIEGNAILADPIRNNLMNLCGVVASSKKPATKQEMRAVAQHAFALRRGKKSKS
ncbi:MAG: AbrB/MazE/SpoVT family DNA-binding domain-containing protein [Verrucomicrobiota bacterium]|nr:AbrB/MazE/SpoVT family DNA-binding domain-containing protein [Verrucomicrobiota bacterium]